MVEIQFPGRPPLQITHVLSDINGTLCLDGCLIDGVLERINELKRSVEITLLSANTTGTGPQVAQTLGVHYLSIQPGDEIRQKVTVLRQLGVGNTITLGQGANDAGMLREAALGICVLSREGTAISALQAADLVVPDITTALDLIITPLRITATLRA
jgi:soluble P-type ATPase